MTEKQKFLAELMRQFPGSGNQTIAKIAHARNPRLFTSLKSTTGIVQHMRGVNNHSREKGIPEFMRPKSKAGQGCFPKLRDGKTFFQDWKPRIISGPCRALILADLHIPYHYRDGIVLALQYGIDRGAGLLVLNGDICDCFSVSLWEKDPRRRNFKEEIEITRDFICELRDQFPHGRILFKLGNHEERLERYMFVKAPELLGLNEFEIPALFGLAKDEVVADKRPIKIGQLNIIHGHEYRFAISNPVNPARGFFLRCKSYVLGAHLHQSSYHAEKTIDQKNLAAWSIGCLCDLHPDYRPLNNWNHGFAFVEVAADGKFHVENKFISSGKVY
jgi:predicted phosphodiesterase